jgi:hypothetical protein
MEREIKFTLLRTLSFAPLNALVFRVLPIPVFSMVGVIDHYVVLNPSIQSLGLRRRVPPLSDTP